MNINQLNDIILFFHIFMLFSWTLQPLASKKTKHKHPLSCYYSHFFFCLYQDQLTLKLDNAHPKRKSTSFCPANYSGRTIYHSIITWVVCKATPQVCFNVRNNSDFLCSSATEPSSCIFQQLSASDETRERTSPICLQDFGFLNITVHITVKLLFTLYFWENFLKMHQQRAYVSDKKKKKELSKSPCLFSSSVLFFSQSDALVSECTSTKC